MAGAAGFSAYCTAATNFTAAQQWSHFLIVNAGERLHSSLRNACTSVDWVSFISERTASLRGVAPHKQAQEQDRKSSQKALSEPLVAPEKQEAPSKDAATAAATASPEATQAAKFVEAKLAEAQVSAAFLVQIDTRQTLILGAESGDQLLFITHRLQGKLAQVELLRKVCNYRAFLLVQKQRNARKGLGRPPAGPIRPVQTAARSRMRDHWIEVLALLLVFGLTVFVSVHLGYKMGWDEHDTGISEVELSETLARWEDAKWCELMPSCRLRRSCGVGGTVRHQRAFRGDVTCYAQVGGSWKGAGQAHGAVTAGYSGPPPRDRTLQG